MVRPGRPVLPIKGDAVAREPAFIEPPDGEIMVRRLLDAAPTINPIIPLVGRIDVANFPRNASFLGTGWLVEPDMVVTNSHVAELIGLADEDGKAVRRKPVGVASDRKPGVDLALDAERDPVDQLRRPWTRGDDHGVEFAEQPLDGADPVVAANIGHLPQHRRQSDFGIQDARLPIQDRDLVVAKHVAGMAPAQVRGAEQLDIEAVLIRRSLGADDRLG